MLPGEAACCTSAMTERRTLTPACPRRSRLPQLSDDILGLICDMLVQPVPTPQPNSQRLSGMVIGNPRLLRTLRHLCCVSKRVDGEARSRLYRHIAVPKESFHADETGRERANARTLQLLCQTLCDSDAAYPSPTWLGSPLAHFVRTLHLWVHADIDTVRDVTRLIDACRGVRMVSLVFLGADTPALQDLGLAGLCASLERLSDLTILSWSVDVFALVDDAILLAPLFCMDLPALESLRIQALVGCGETADTALGGWTRKERAALPRLRHCELCYVLSPPTDDAALPYTREEGMRHVSTILALLDHSPNIEALALNTNLLGGQICHVLSPHLERNLRYLGLRVLGDASDPVLDIEPLAKVTRLSDFSSDNAAQERGWYSIPSSVGTLELTFLSAAEMVRFTRFLAHKSNLPALRRLNIFCLWLAGPENSVDETRRKEMQGAEGKLRDVAAKRGILVRLET